MRIIKPILAGLITLSASQALAADTTEVRLGVRGVANYSVLSGPTDAAGDPTLLSGAAFTGFGGGGGLAGMFFLSKISAGDIYLALDLLYVAHSATGKAEAPATDQRRTATLKSNILHAPLHLGLRAKSDAIGYRVSLGPELLLGLGSASQVDQENIPEPPQPLFTTPVTHVGLSANVGFDIDFSDWIVPIDVRFVYDPNIPASSRDRFDNFESASAPGNYQVGYDYQVFVSVGVDRLFHLSK